MQSGLVSGLLSGGVTVLQRVSSAGLGAVLRSRFCGDQEQGPAAPWGGSGRGFRDGILRLWVRGTYTTVLCGCANSVL